ncbi:MAG: HAMP domain-containing histidine kinase [Synergistaceae bacterium]|jgi:signal transduction histidine kinase|nr:HAMP domain-containing histidine kinase [Synergistaceae bacterium]
MYSLKSKLIVSYIFFAALIICSLSIIFNIAADKLFEQCVIAQRSRQIDMIIEQVKKQYISQRGIYNVDGLEIIGNAALQNGLIIRIRTENGELDWDARRHREQECLILLRRAEMNMLGRYPKFHGGYIEDIYDIEYGEKIVANLSIGYYGPYSLETHEIAFLDSLNKTLVFIGMASMSLAIALGMAMSRRFSAPIARAIEAARSIAAGDYEIHDEKIPTTAESANLLPSIRQMARALSRKEQQKKQITDDVAHELRTPLGNLQSRMEAMIDGVWEPSAEHLQSCHTEIMRLSGIVEQLAELSLLEGGNASYEMAEFDFGELCEQVRDDFRADIKEKEISFKILAPKSSLLYGDADRVKQCLTNLISNAIKYSACRGEIIVTCDIAPGYTTIRVRDNGQGIPEEDMPHIFERFYKADKSRSQKAGGMGIGLAITKAIVKAHNGEIEAQSAIGSGTTFTITLPLCR